MLGFKNNNLLVKVTSANTLLVAARTLFSIITQKALAILVGAEGISVIGNLRNILSFLENFTIIGVSNGLIKYVSQYKNDKENLSKLFSTIFVFSVFACIFSFIILLVYSNAISDFIFGVENDFSFIIQILAFILPFIAINSVLNALVNGLSDYKGFTKVILLTSILGSIIVVTCAYQNGLFGGLLAITLIPFIQFISYLLLLSKSTWHQIKVKDLKWKIPFKKQLLSYSFMSLIVILFINLTDILLRDLIENKVSLAEAGYWTAMNSISKNYMQFSAALFPLYILPQYAKIKDTLGYRKEVSKIYKMLLPLLILGLLGIYFAREFIIRVLYSEDFLSMAPLFKWQLVGDFVKFIAIVLAYQFLAKKQVFNFIFTELLSVGLFYVFSVYFLNDFGTEGVVMANLLRYIVYLIVVCFILRHNFFGNKELN